MDLTESGASSLGILLGMSLSYVFLAAYHTVLSEVLGALFAFILKHLLSLTPIIINPAVLNPSCYIHVALFARMPDTWEWVEAAWTLLTRDGPPKGLPGAEIADVITKGLLLISYMIDAIAIYYASIILSVIATYLTLILCLGISLALLFPVSVESYRWLSSRTGSKKYEGESTLRLGSRLLLTGVIRVITAVYQACSGSHQNWADGTTYIQEFFRPYIESYSQSKANGIYKYQSLDTPERQIRLIKITRGLIKGITCSLEHYPLNKAAKYEAISYTWGSPKKDHVVFCGKAYLPTTRNVYMIFQDRASYFKTRWLWIDAICINQADEAEKSIQVGMMGDIYQNAKRVVVWLGDIPFKASTFTAAMMLLERLNYTIQNYEYYRARLGSMQLVFGSHDSWTVLGHLLTHPYWQRTWIVQEIAKGRKVHIYCGGRYISWVAFSDMLRLLAVAPGNKIVRTELVILRSDVTGIMSGITQVNLIRVIRDTLLEKGLLTLEEALLFTQKCKATEPIDKVFALANLVQLGDLDEEIDVRPNYSLTVQEVYTRTARYLISRGVSLIHLQTGVGYPREVSKLPSWVPDWSNIKQVSLLTETDALNSSDKYQASGIRDSQTPLKLSSNNLIAELIAVPIGKIAYISDVAYPRSPDVESVKLFLRSAHSTASSHAPEKHPLNSQDRAEAFWRTLIGDRHPIPDLAQNEAVQFQWPAQPVYSDYYLVLVNGMSDKKEPVKQEQEQAERKASFEASFAFSRALANACSDEKRFAITEDGGMALVPPLAEVGDKIFLVRNAPKPILLREGSEEDPEGCKLNLVGDCYVHGVMGGELWDNGETATTIRIC
jgi:Heterokaryon incompatibility protein (HET)